MVLYKILVITIITNNEKYNIIPGYSESIVLSNNCIKTFLVFRQLLCIFVKIGFERHSVEPSRHFKWRIFPLRVIIPNISIMITSCTICAYTMHTINFLSYPLQILHREVKDKLSCYRILQINNDFINVNVDVAVKMHVSGH